MQPPICELCHRDQRDDSEMEFGLVEFAEYEPIDGPGHPDGLLWFCDRHLAEAKKLRFQSSKEALRYLRILYRHD